MRTVIGEEGKDGETVFNVCMTLMILHGVVLERVTGGVKGAIAGGEEPKTLRGERHGERLCVDFQVTESDDRVSTGESDSKPAATN